MDNYTMRTFEKHFDMCYNQLAELGYKTELNKKRYQLQFMESVTTLGRCHNHGSNRYTIYLNKNHVNVSEEKYILDTVMHELIHSLDSCMCHTGRWKQVANMVNMRYGYNISRLETDDSAYSKFYNETNASRIKYELVCNSCGAVTTYQRKSKSLINIMNHAGRYRCRACNSINSFSVKELN